MRLLVLALALAASPAVAAPFTVVIDPGHGGPHDGARSPAGVREKEVVLAVAKKLEALLSAEPGTHDVLTRTEDEDVALHDRPALANRAKGDLFVSIHCNSAATAKLRRAWTGVETYYLSPNATDAAARALAERENADAHAPGAAAALSPVDLILQDLARSQAHQDSSRVARIVQTQLVRALRARDRGVRQAPFIVLLGAEMPAVLVEIGFISHPDEGKRLAEARHQQKVAEALRDAVRGYREQVFARVAAPTAPAAVPARAPASAASPK